MAKRPQNTEIEVGDLVEVVAGPDAHWIGMVGVLDNLWQGKFVVVDPDHEDEFTYALEVKLYKKAS